MQIRPYLENDGPSVWLSASEQQQLRDQFDEHPDRELAVRLRLAGLRASEIVDVSRSDLRELNGDAPVVKLRVVDAKRSDREVPISVNLASDLRTVANVLGVRETDPSPEPVDGRDATAGPCPDCDGTITLDETGLWRCENCGRHWSHSVTSPDR